MPVWKGSRFTGNLLFKTTKNDLKLSFIVQFLFFSLFLPPFQLVYTTSVYAYLPGFQYLSTKTSFNLGVLYFVIKVFVRNGCYCFLFLFHIMLQAYYFTLFTCLETIFMSALLYTLAIKALSFLYKQIISK